MTESALRRVFVPRAATLVLKKQLDHYTRPFGAADPAKVIATRDVLSDFGGLTKKPEPGDYDMAAFIAGANDFDAAAIAGLPSRQ
jgi:hypothetical protein